MRRRANLACCWRLLKRPSMPGIVARQSICTVRQGFPQLESQPMGDVPRVVWQTAYALPFASSIRRWSAKAAIDPMLVAGLIRQESAFEPEAHSPANAYGLMQLEPSTAHRLARGEKSIIPNPVCSIRITMCASEPCT